MGNACWLRGDRDLADEHLARARDLVEHSAPSPVKAQVMAEGSRFFILAGDYRAAIALGGEALAMAEQLGLPTPEAATLNNIGSATAFMGNSAGGIEKLERSVAVATRQNAAYEACRALNNLATALWGAGQLIRSRDTGREFEAAIVRYGETLFARWARASPAAWDFAIGLWDDALRRANAVIAEVESGSPHYLAAETYVTRASILLARSEVARVLEDVDTAIDGAHRAKDPQLLIAVIATSAHVLMELGDTQRADALASESLAVLRQHGLQGYVAWPTHRLAWTLASLGRSEELIRLEPVDPSPWVTAALQFARGDIEASAETCAAMGAVSEAARDRLWLAERLVAEDRRPEADAQAQRALAFYRSVGATRYSRMAGSLLGMSP
ncbi:MAG: hypothetical protein WB802_10505 [Candidatus Dormiibacterota bacterium]